MDAGVGVDGSPARNDPRRQEGLQSARATMAEIFDGAAQFVDLTVVGEVSEGAHSDNCLVRPVRSAISDWWRPLVTC